MADRVIFVCILLLAGVYFYATEQLPSLEIGDPLGPKAFPFVLGAGLLISAFVLLLEMLRERKSPTKTVAAPAPEVSSRGAQLVVAAAAIWTLLYFFAFESLGYVLATALYLLVLTGCFNRGKWVANVLTSLLFPVTSYLMFTKLLGVNLPPGVLPF